MFHVDIYALTNLDSQTSNTLNKNKNKWAFCVRKILEFKSLRACGSSGV